MKKNFLKSPIIYYFYKLLKIYRNKKPSLHFGEFGEDIFINRILKNINQGKYVDVGCYHPYKGSLTFELYKRGWNGVNIDVSKTSIDLFNMSRKKDINLNLAISNFDGETFYYENSPINQQNSLIQMNKLQKKIKIKCLTLDTVLNNKNLDEFDYLNIDVEGSELEVIKGFNLKRFNPKLITIENNDLTIDEYLKSEVCKILIENDYILVNKIGVTNFFMPSKLVYKISDLIKI